MNAYFKEARQLLPKETYVSRASYSFNPNAAPAEDFAAFIANMGEHPLESSNFQIEDMWIVEKIQRTLHSPHYEVGPMAADDGAEGPLTHFQESVLDFVTPVAKKI